MNARSKLLWILVSLVMLQSPRVWAEADEGNLTLGEAETNNELLLEENSPVSGEASSNVPAIENPTPEMDPVEGEELLNTTGTEIAANDVTMERRETSLRQRVTANRQGIELGGPGRLNLSLGAEVTVINAPPSGTLPLAELLYAPSEHFAAGLNFAYANSNFFVLGLNANFYPRTAYNGFWFQFGTGCFFIKTTELGQALDVRSTVGWRWHSTSVNGSFGFAIGPQLIVPVAKMSGEAVFQLFARFDLGIDFLIGDFFY